MSTVEWVALAWAACVLAFFVWFIFIPFLFGPAWLTHLLHRDWWRKH